MADEAKEGTDSPEESEETPGATDHAEAEPVETDGYGDGPLDGIVAFFEHPDDTLIAATKCRDRGFDKWDVFTPFPVHGMDDAMGLGRSWMPWATFALAMTGLATAAFMEFGTMVFDWPIIVGGKPYAAWPSFIPIMFEMMVLFAGVGSAAVMIWAVGLPTLKPKLIDPRISRDRFAIWVSSEDGKFERTATRAFLESLDPLEVREVASNP
jgi:hypothetical protein